MLKFAARLVEERKRVCPKAQDWAAQMELRAATQSAYENGHRIPDAEYLMRASKLGVDVLYVLAGRRELPREADDQAFDRLTVLWADLPDAVRVSVVNLVETIASQKGGRGRAD